VTGRGVEVKPSDARRVVALAHEVGNLLAAVRMSAHLLPLAGSAGERARAATELERWVAHAGELLALVRSLLSDSGGRRSRVAVAEVLGGLEQILALPGEVSGGISVAGAPRGVSHVRVDLDALHHVLLVLVRTLFAAQPEADVSVRAGRRGARIDFVVASTGTCASQGADLALDVANAALRGSRGRVTRDKVRKGASFRVSLPAAK
jgi:hypothetical protein